MKNRKYIFQLLGHCGFFLSKKNPEKFLEPILNFRNVVIKSISYECYQTLLDISGEAKNVLFGKSIKKEKE